MTQNNFDWFMDQFYRLTGVDLREYKRQQMERRLTSLRDRRGFSSFEEYIHAVSRDSDLLAELVDRMTINVSEFFRNEVRWETLVQRVLPKIYAGTSLKIWSAACSTGQEPYTILMALSSKVALPSISLLATDIDDRALSIATAGEYQAELVKGIPPEILSKFFKKTESGQFRVEASLRERITFRKHNLLSDTYPSELDLIVCRNVLIYFTDEAKAQIYQKFARSLRKGGVLFLGSTEQIFHPEEIGLRQIEPFFYQKG
jgi:chemotaxis protein methyltransferase CheR